MMYLYSAGTHPYRLPLNHYLVIFILFSHHGHQDSVAASVCESPVLPTFTHIVAHYGYVAPQLVWLCSPVAPYLCDCVTYVVM